MTLQQTDDQPQNAFSLSDSNLSDPSLTALGLGDCSLDEVALVRLVALAGPDDGPELMRRLIGDVGDVFSGITTGFATQDREAMRRHSHVLIAIAGTIGAHHIYHLALHLNQCARDDTCGEAAPQTVDLIDRLSGLIQRLHLVSARMGMA